MIFNEIFDIIQIYCLHGRSNGGIGGYLPTHAHQIEFKIFFLFSN